jgi:predicted outer membrane protein
MANKLGKWIALTGAALMITAPTLSSASVAETNKNFSSLIESSALPGEEYAASLYTSDTVAQLHRSNLEKINLAQLAIEKGDSSLVRALAKRVYRDQTLANRRLLSLTMEGDIALPVAAPFPDKSKTIVALQGLSGKKFDVAYANSLLQWAEENAGLWASGSSGLPLDPKLKIYLKKYSIFGEQHRQVASRIRDTLR